MKKVKSFHIFITGGAGARKLHLIKSIFMSLCKVLGSKGDNAEKSTILLLALTGVTAMNIKRTTIHSGLGINVRSMLYLLIK